MATSKQDLTDFYNELARTSAQHEEDMTVLRSKLDVLLQNFEDLPLLVPAAPRLAVHKYDNKTPVDFGTADVFDLQRGYHMSWSPVPADKEVYLYATMVRRSGDEDGYTQFLRPSVVGDEWCAHHHDGRLVYRSINGGDTLINIKDPTWQSNAISRIVSELLAHKATGLYLDEVDWSLSFAFPVVKERTCREFPTDMDWRNALLQFIQRLVGELRAYGMKLWINYGANSYVDSQWHNNILRTVDAINSEFFIGREALGAPPAVLRDGWEEQTAVVGEAERMGVPAHVRCNSTNQSVVDYAFLSWLAVTEFKGSFSASTNYAGPIARPSESLWQAASRLGQPRGGYANSAYGYYRQFEKGVVRVNPFTVIKNGASPQTGSIVLQS